LEDLALLNLAQTSLPMPPFLYACLAVAVGMLLWDTIEVGRNDGTNLVNAIVGARVLRHRHAILLAGAGVLLGACMSGGVIETARKGIFNPGMLTLQGALAVYVSVYIVDTILLYSYSAFAMPVSTTACLIFELLGASFALKYGSIVNWEVSGKVVLAIVCSVILAGFAAFMVQRVMRGALRDRTESLTLLMAHGGWAGGGMATALCYFLLLKGMKHVPFVKYLRTDVVESYGTTVVVLVLWVIFAVIIHVLLIVFRKKAARLLFPVLAVLGMLAMAFAFGQNDLANCASPGLSAIALLQNRDQDVASASNVEIGVWALAGCGVLLVFGMHTSNAKRVTNATIGTGSMSNLVELWAPDWCIALARFLLRFRRRVPSLAPKPAITAQGKEMHYDALRASVIMSVSACVIASASSLKLPVSTTYVTFAAVIATGMADRIFQRGDAELKLGRAIWVMFSWVAAAVIAAVAAGCVCRIVYHWSLWGIALAIGLNLLVRRIVKRRADAQAARVREAAYERMYPEQFAEEIDGA
jgi:phosphate/sulfate permease